MKKWLLFLFLFASSVLPATYYVRATDGDDGDDGLTVGNAWATVQFAADNATSAGDIVLICADGDHVQSATVDFDANAGTLQNAIIFRGCAADGTDDGTMATITGSGLSPSDDLINIDLIGVFNIYENLRFTAATQYNINIGTNCNTAEIAFIDCRIDHATSAGFYTQESDAQIKIQFIHCLIDSNGSDGIASAGIGRGCFSVYSSSVHHNAGDGIEETNGSSPKTIFANNLIYRNDGHGINFTNNCKSPELIGNTFFANGGSGVYFGDVDIGFIVLYNNISKSNTTYGYYFTNASGNQYSYMDYNCVNGNGTASTNINGGTLPGSNNITSDPLFTSETNGAEDLTLQSGSPCKNVGLSPYGY